jgi:hypothetical protein
MWICIWEYKLECVDGVKLRAHPKVHHCRERRAPPTHLFPLREHCEEGGVVVQEHGRPVLPPHGWLDLLLLLLVALSTRRAATRQGDTGEILSAVNMSS